VAVLYLARAAKMFVLSRLCLLLAICKSYYLGIDFAYLVDGLPIVGCCICLITAASGKVIYSSKCYGAILFNLSWTRCWRLAIYSFICAGGKFKFRANVLIVRTPKLSPVLFGSGESSPFSFFGNFSMFLFFYVCLSYEISFRSLLSASDVTFFAMLLRLLFPEAGIASVLDWNFFLFSRM
jgi:hypothetical protein